VVRLCCLKAFTTSCLMHPTLRQVGDSRAGRLLAGGGWWTGAGCTALMGIYNCVRAFPAENTGPNGSVHGAATVLSGLGVVVHELVHAGREFRIQTLVLQVCSWDWCADSRTLQARLFCCCYQWQGEAGGNVAEAKRWNMVHDYVMDSWYRLSCVGKGLRAAHAWCFSLALSVLG